MIEIVQHLYIGNAIDAAKKPRHIEWYLNVADEIVYDAPPRAGVVKCPLGERNDGARSALAARLGADIVRAGQNLLVHCKHGLNRSVAILVCILMELGYDEERARRLVEMKHPGADPVEQIITDYRRERKSP